MENGFIYGLVGMIGLSMMMELTNVIIEICKVAKEKCRKKTAEEKLKIQEKLKLS